MKRIDLGDIGNLAEAIAAVGVLVSLIYLGVQVRQNTNALQASSYQSVADHVTDFQRGLAESADLTRIYLIGIEDPAGLSPEEKLQFDMYLGMAFARFDTAVELYHRGMIDERMMRPYSRFLLYQFQFPGVGEYWQNAQEFFSDAARSYIEDLRKAAPHADHEQSDQSGE